MVYFFIYSVTIDVKKPAPPIPGFEIGGQLEFGTNCIYDADFDVNVSVYKDLNVANTDLYCSQ